MNNKKINVNNVKSVYLCIKKDHFNENMVYLNYNNLKQKKSIAIIYKSPSIFLDGLFFQTPQLSNTDFTITKYEKQKVNQDNYNIILNLNEKNVEHKQLINIMSRLDQYIINYLKKFKKEIQHELIINYGDDRPIEKFKYIFLIKKNNNKWQINMKSYIDKNIIDLINKNKKDNEVKKYKFTFNISNIFFSYNSLLPLIKTNYVEIIT
jgi:hypothetical protein